MGITVFPTCLQRGHKNSPRSTSRTIPILVQKRITKYECTWLRERESEWVRVRMRVRVRVREWMNEREKKLKQQKQCQQNEKEL
jgi:hypothetical protein